MKRMIGYAYPLSKGESRPTLEEFAAHSTTLRDDRARG